jgi:Fe-S-cluster containining protein
MKLSENLLSKHQETRRRLDDRFRRIRVKYADRMQCGRGCARCCHGLFDVSLPDALCVAEGFKKLSGRIQAEIAERASVIQQRLKSQNADFKPPYFLDAGDQDGIDRLVESAAEVRCPLLDAENACLLYDNRPIQCRLEGVPMVDAEDGLFGDWCELNFKEGVTAEIAGDLSLDYREIQAVEQTVTIFIPSVICDRDRW